MKSLIREREGYRTCPDCGKGVLIPDDLFGGKYECSFCKAWFKEGGG